MIRLANSSRDLRRKPEEWSAEQLNRVESQRWFRTSDPAATGYGSPQIILMIDVAELGIDPGALA